MFAGLCLASSLVRTYTSRVVDDVTTGHSKPLRPVTSHSTCAFTSRDFFTLSFRGFFWRLLTTLRTLRAIVLCDKLVYDLRPLRYTTNRLLLTSICPRSNITDPVTANVSSSICMHGNQHRIYTCSLSNHGDCWFLTLFGPADFHPLQHCVPF